MSCVDLRVSATTNWRGSLVAAGLSMSLLAPMNLMADAFTDTLTPTDIAMLPPYCKYTQHFRSVVPGGQDKAQLDRWESIMGPDSQGIGGGIFQHMHHYCQGLIHFNYANLSARNKLDGLRRLGDAIREFEYVLRHSPPQFILLPEILTKKGEALIKLNRAPLAIGDLRRAIELKPDYWPPYAALSDYYKQIGSTKMARELLGQGLSASPDAAALKRRLTELDAVKGEPKTPAALGAKTE